jgi:hypothetical protein
MADQAERKILDMVEEGAITAEEGLRLINAMGGSREITPTQSENLEGIDDSEQSPAPQIPPEERRRMNRLKRWWVLPFGIGLLITTLGAIWMYTAYGASGFGWGFWLAWFPFLLGIFVVAVSFQTSSSLWLHVRVKQKPGESPGRIAISLPLPIGLTRWVLKHFGRRIPGLKDQPLESYSEILENLSPEEPFYVHVNEGDGEEVEVFIG